MSVPPKHLESVFAKVARAQQHLNALDGEIGRYLEDCAKTISMPVKVNPSANAIKLYFAPVAEPPLEISMMIGDCVFNARSSLDHLWKRLNGTNNFPIFADLQGPNNWNAHKVAKLATIDPSAHAIIDALQPCHHGKDAWLHPLAVLNKLSNQDKHDAIHLTKPHSTDTEYIFMPQGSSRIAHVIRPPVVFHDKTEVVVSDAPSDILQPGMEVKVKGTLFVSLQDSAWASRPIQEILSRIIDIIQRGVIAPLVPYTS